MVMQMVNKMEMGRDDLLILKLSILIASFHLTGTTSRITIALGNILTHKYSKR